MKFESFRSYTEQISLNQLHDGATISHVAVLTDENKFLGSASLNLISHGYDINRKCL
jgi:hypothetical protein